MGGLIKLIKNLFSSIFSFLSGLVGGKKSIEGSAPKTRKSSGYFLELDDSEASKKPVNKPIAESSLAPVAAISNAAQNSKPSSNRAELLAAAASNGSAPVAQKTVEKAPVAVAPKPEASAEFATKYLVPTSNGSRRRPGANMNSYLDMARGMKPN